MTGTSLRERVLIGELSRMGLKDQQIAEKLGMKERTVRKWRQRALKGAADLVSQMGRPRKGAMNSFSRVVLELLQRWRSEHPGWGPKTLWAELAQHPALQGEVLPSQATIARWLKQTGQTRVYQKQARLPQVLSPASACHEEWELDARGQEMIDGVGMVSLIEMNDVFSRLKLISYPCWLGTTRMERYPATADYQLVARRAFAIWGLPDRLAVDRAHVFFDVNTPTPFPTQFHLWLLALGVQVTFGRPAIPQDQGVTERSHQTWWAQVVEGQTFPNLMSLWLALETRRDFLNESLPCQTLGDLAPLVAYPEARQPRRRYRPEVEADLLDLQRIYDFLGTCRWFRQSSKVGTVSLGGHNYSLGNAWYSREVSITFDPQSHAFTFRSPKNATAKVLPIRWLTKAFLMGEFAPLTCFPYFQLMLPFSLEAFRTEQLTRLFDTSLP